ncbi:MAG: VOC family protein [Tepidiformaceae bacterium]
MEITGSFVNITTDNAERLGDFYRNTVGLESQEGMGPYAFKFGGTTISFDSHSDTSGAAKEPSRVIFSMFVDDLAAEQKSLEAKGVKFSRTAGKEEWGGLISTFSDPDGNLMQLIEYKGE